MDKMLVEWLMNHGYIGVLIGFGVIFLTITIVVRVNKLLDKVVDYKADTAKRFALKNAKIENLQAQINLLEKRTSKILVVMGKCPAPTVQNKLWLQNDKRNGGECPDNFSACEGDYEDDKD